MVISITNLGLLGETMNHTLEVHDTVTGGRGVEQCSSNYRGAGGCHTGGHYIQAVGMRGASSTEN